MSFSCLPTGRLSALFALFVGLFSSLSAYATNVTMSTPFGIVEIELFDEAAPDTVANFLQYISEGKYVNSFIHRSDPGFVI